MEPRDRIADVLRRPGAYGLRTFEQAAAFVMGFDAALDWEFLQGFQEWLAREVGEGENIAWPALVPRLASARSVTGSAGCEGVDLNMATLFNSMKKFLELSPE